MRGGWVYIMTNRPNGVLYIGVTSDLSRRAYEHRQGAIPGFTQRYGLKRLVWFTRFDDIRDAIQHEKNGPCLSLKSGPLDARSGRGNLLAMLGGKQESQKNEQAPKQRANV